MFEKLMIVLEIKKKNTLVVSPIHVKWIKFGNTFYLSIECMHGFYDKTSKLQCKILVIYAIFNTAMTVFYKKKK